LVVAFHECSRARVLDGPRIPPGLVERAIKWLSRPQPCMTAEVAILSEWVRQRERATTNLILGTRDFVLGKSWTIERGEPR
jgi:hypothetical protein